LGSLAGEDCSESDFLCFDTADVLVILALPALALWAAGLLVMWIVIRIARRRRRP
jgi:hypothetical protein